MATTDFKAFAGGGSAVVLTQAAYNALTTIIANGFPSGILPAVNLNKLLRQATIPGAVLTQFIADLTGVNSVDDGTTATLLANLKIAVQGTLSTSGNGYQKFPSGLVLQWFTITTSNSAYASVNFPIQFPTAVLGGAWTVNSVTTSQAFAMQNFPNRTAANYAAIAVGGAYTNVTGYGLAVGY